MSFFSTFGRIPACVNIFTFPCNRGQRLPNKEWDGRSPRQNLGQDYLAPFFYKMMNVTYILYSVKINKYYTGQTTDLIRRLEEHNRGKTAFMASGLPWKLIFYKELKSRQEATRLEQIIKKRGAKRFLEDNNIQAD